jgi:phospholipase/lecithinase/hemolysin
VRTKIVTALAVAAVCSSLLAPIAAASVFSNVFVFGDSLSDTGNLAEFQGANFPNPPFFNDSVTNGPPAVVLLAQHFGLSERPSLFANGFQDTHNLFGPGFTFGTNYAFAGARAKASTPGQADLTDQVNAFLARPGGGATAPSDALYVVWIGGNDIRTAGHSNDIPTATGLVTSAVNAIASDIQTLINKGAHTILVPNAGDVGAIPEFTKESPLSQAQLATQSSILFNQLLQLALANIQVLNPGVNLDEFDFFDFSKDVAANAASLGITNTTDPCLKANFSPNANCFNLATQQITFDKFLFWDHIHPTGVVQAAWAEGLIAAVPAPEPATLDLVALGLGLFLFKGRRRGV